MNPEFSKTLSTAPMMDWTDSHCRYFFRLLSPNSLVYTEMIPTKALIYGNKNKLLHFNPLENPVSLQLGGNNPRELAKCAEIAEELGYSEINLNCGCPSDRVVDGEFGVSLMNNPTLVKNCMFELIKSVSIPVTIKHRLGIGPNFKYDFLHQFVETVGESGCTRFIVHARNAILGGLSPSDNRKIPPLNYEYVYKLRETFPEFSFILNGGINSLFTIEKEINQVSGLMIGRAAYKDPYFLAQADQLIFGSSIPSRLKIAKRMERYAREQIVNGVPIQSITKCMLGLFKNQPNARLWRQILSSHKALSELGPEIISYALSSVKTDSDEGVEPQNWSYAL